MRWRSPSPQPRPQIDTVLQAMTRMTDAIRGLATALAPTIAPQRELTYEDAIGWFVENPPPAEVEVAGGALLRSPLADGRTEIVQIFLTEGNEVAGDARGVPFGRRFVVERLDDELAESFGDTALLIVN